MSLALVDEFVKNVISTMRELRLVFEVSVMDQYSVEKAVLEAH